MECGVGIRAISGDDGEECTHRRWVGTRGVGEESEEGSKCIGSFRSLKTKFLVPISALLYSLSKNAAVSSLVVVAFAGLRPPSRRKIVEKIS